MVETVLLRNAFLIDGNGGDPLPDATVVLSKGTIREIVSEEKGAYLVPTLI